MDPIAPAESNSHRYPGSKVVQNPHRVRAKSFSLHPQKKPGPFLFTPQKKPGIAKSEPTGAKCSQVTPVKSPSPLFPRYSFHAFNLPFTFGDPAITWGFLPWGWPLWSGRGK